MDLKVILTMVAAVGLPVWAGPTVILDDDFNNQQTWDQGWSTQGSVSWGNALNEHQGYVRLGSGIDNTTNRFSHSFTTTSGGLYNLGFDYRFVGWDLVGGSPNPKDSVNVLFDISGPGNTKVFSWNSNNDLSWQWQTTTPPAQILLDENTTYELTFRHKETDSDFYGLGIATEFHLDNVKLWTTSDSVADADSAVVVPAPTASLLAGIGLLLVGGYCYGRKKAV